MSIDWTPGESADTNTCPNCGSHVTPQFIRVFAKNGELEGCLDCMSRRELTGGSGL